MGTSVGYEKDLDNYVKNERAAVKLARHVGELLYDKGIELVLFRNHLVDITTSEKGDSNVVIGNTNGEKTSQVLPKGLILTVKQGDTVKADQALNINPNAGGFGQEDGEIVLQNPIRIVGYLAFCFVVLLTQVALVLKKKQFEKVQAAELNF